MYSPFPKPSRPITIVGVHASVPKRNECSRTKCNHVHIFVFSIILCNAFCQHLAAPIECIRPANTSCGNENNFVNTERSSRLENLESSAHVQVKEIVGTFLATNFVNAV